MSSSSVNVGKQKLLRMKVDTPVFKGIFNDELNTLRAIFQKYNFDIKIAGGAVRDILLGHPPIDLDFATIATPEQMKEMFKKEKIRIINTNGEKHGTVTARIDDKMNYEITTLRIDRVTFGRHAEVEFVSDWALDAARRDLTINAMFLDLDGNLVDYFNGYEDLTQRRIRFVGDPAKRIQEDYLRILRYYRFYGRFAKCPESHDTETIRAIKENAGGLKDVSGERIWVELGKILAGRFGTEMIRHIIESGISIYLGVCDIPNMAEFDAVKDRCMMEKELPLHPITILSSLMRNTEDVENLHRRLKLSAFERDLALFLVQNREDTLQVKPMIRYKGLVIRSNKSPKDAKKFVEELIKYDGRTSVLKEFQDWVPTKFPVKGETLIKNGVPKGQMMSIVIKRLKDAWIKSDFQMTAENLIKIIPEMDDFLSSVSTQKLKQT